MPGSLSRAASMATEPEPAPMSQTTLPGWIASLGQGDGAHLGLGDQAALGPALGEDVVGVAEAAQARRRRRLIGPARLALQDQHVQRRELHLLNVAQFALGDALVGAAEVLADIGAEIIEAAGQQLPGDLWPAPPPRW